jgi:glycosyltransferase involved in cell wall biosynthesis
LGRRLANRLARRWKRLPSAARPEAWLTYHLYHKAPDWIGPLFAKEFAIPYAAVEVSYAPRQAGGPWASGLRQVARSIAAADLVVGLNPEDAECVRPLMRVGAAYVDFAPFIDGRPLREAAARRLEARSSITAATGLNARHLWIIAVGMMRPGNKLACYATLAEALARLSSLDWQLLVVGEGPARLEVEALLAPFRDRTRLLGALSGEALANAYAAADLLAWPAIREPIGMVFLEAQAAALPVVGADRPGPAGIVADGRTGLLCKEGDAVALADAIGLLLREEPRRRAMGAAAFEHALQSHDLSTAGRRFAKTIEGLIK